MRKPSSHSLYCRCPPDEPVCVCGHAECLHHDVAGKVLLHSLRNCRIMGCDCRTIVRKDKDGESYSQELVVAEESSGPIIAT